ncbi:RNA-binding transcriptional accessory protein [Christensenellaceae bacterium OttesenSCG-928-M15]|nr:RNA-binding transcriptional accessory protein [Christensenellaceae bacterium OttesenSCG-928-M15]
MDIVTALKQDFPALAAWQIENVVKLIDEGNTIPFIARYRKEQHGELNDQVLRELSERLTYLRSFMARKEEIRAALIKQEALTEDLDAALERCKLLAELEDLYRPFKPKRRTRAMIAKEKGLEPLAIRFMLQQKNDPEPVELAKEYINPELGVETAQDAIDGAKDIIAEQFSDDAAVRSRLRALIERRGMITTQKTKDEDSVYSMYYEFSEPVGRIPGHRILAIDRGEREEFLKVKIEVPEPDALSAVEHNAIRENAPSSLIVREAARDAYTRLISPSMDRETRAMLTERAQEAAIKVFAKNLNDLLLQPPLKGRVVLGLDPGIRTGCKLAVVDAFSNVLDTGVIYPLPTHGKVEAAKKTVAALIKKHGVTAVAIGNGTASRETEKFFVDLMQEQSEKIPYMIVDEAGASVYSASKLAAEEFPEYDVSLRSAVSIARRLQDPLSELVKIEPNAIGVGQYQHDMKAARLNEALTGVVELCVNQVGVDVNTASVSLLSYVAGVSKTVAQNILAFRSENGPFRSRAQLKKVPKLGPKAYEQCAGFLRIAGGTNPLDNTSVHPESYPIAEALLSKFHFTNTDIAAGKLKNLGELVGEVGSRTLAMQLNVGAPTFRDIVRELVKPGRDPRDDLPKPLLRTDVLEMKDLLNGMELKGTVRNVTDFGAFVDIGVHRDGLVHISQMSERRISHPSEAVKVGDVVTVYVQDVDMQKKRISLTMKKPQ